MERESIEILRAYDAIVVGEEDEKYDIEFGDYDGGIVETSLNKKKLDCLPYAIEKNTSFHIVIYKIKGEGELHITSWPIKKYWHKSWNED